jgi:ATP-dependent DNA ligase
MSGVVEQWAGHYQGGGSDKVWAGCYTEDGIFRSTWGRRGSSLAVGEKNLGSSEAAAKQFNKKMKEKVTEGYQSVAFDDPNIGVSSFGPAGAGNATNLPSIVDLITKTVEYQAGHVMPLSMDELDEALGSDNHGVSEKVNGERCIIAYDGKDELNAYNRKGIKVSTIPEGAKNLDGLGCQFVLDGERLTGEQSGVYVAFDLLEWDGKDMRSVPYNQRIKTLEDALTGHNFIERGAALYETGTAQNLFLLVSENNAKKGKDIVQAIRSKGGEGVIVRTHNAHYQAGDTRYIRKFKFLADLDAIVIGVQPGMATGSVILGLIRPSDGAVIEVVRVRGGLKDNDIIKLGEMVKQGERPVLKVEYLPIRTVGIRLVEPKTSMSELRHDKNADECTTDQLGAEKAEMFAKATPFKAEKLVVMKEVPAPFENELL